jgi:hypothetical protein
MKAWLIVVMASLAVGCMAPQPTQANQPIKAGPNLDLLAMLKADMPEGRIVGWKGNPEETGHEKRLGL